MILSSLNTATKIIKSPVMQRSASALNCGHSYTQAFTSKNDSHQRIDASRAYANPIINDKIAIVRKINSEIERFDNIVILTHKFADGDAVGSGLAMKNFIEASYPDKNVQFVVPTGVASILNVMPGRQNIVSQLDEKFPSNYLAIAVDSDQRTMDGLDIYNCASSRVDIDHHDSNVHYKEGKYYDISFLDRKAPSTTEMLYSNYFKGLNIKLSKDVAKCLLIGLITDTGNFKYAQRKSEALKIKDELLSIMNEDGEEHTVSSIMQEMDDARCVSPNAVEMIDYLIEQEKFQLISNNNKKVNCIALTEDDIEAFNVKDSLSDIKNLLNKKINNLMDKKAIGLVFWETEKGAQVKVSIRSQNENICDFAEIFSGGGHQNAAGFTLDCGITEAIDKVSQELDKYNLI